MYLHNAFEENSLKLCRVSKLFMYIIWIKELNLSTNQFLIKIFTLSILVNKYLIIFYFTKHFCGINKKKH